MGQVADHLVFEFDAAIDALQRAELVHVEGGEAIHLDRADVAAGALDPEDLDNFAGQRILFHDLGGGIAAAVIGDPLVRSEEVRTVEELFRLGHSCRLAVVPKIGKARALVLVEHVQLLPLIWLPQHEPRPYDWHQITR